MGLRKLLGDELFNQVQAKLGDTRVEIVSDGNWIPKEKFNALNDDLKDLKSQLKQRDTQLEQLSSKATNSEELTKEIEALKAKNKTLIEDYEAKIKKRDFDYALNNVLASAKAKNVKALTALLDMDKITINDKGEIEGVQEQLKSLRQSDSYLFEGDGLKGRQPNGSGKSSSGINPFSKEHFNLTEQGRLFKENPDLAKQLMEQANN